MGDQENIAMASKIVITMRMKILKIVASTVKRLVLVPGIRMVGFGVNARINVFPKTKEMTLIILHRQFVTEKMIVVAPFMVSLPLLRNVKILSRQIIQHLMKC